LDATVAARDIAVAAKNDTQELADQFADDLETLQTLIEGLESGAVVSVNGHTGIVVLGISDLSGLQTALDAKAATTYVNTQVATKQDTNAKLSAIAALTWAVDVFPYFTGAATLATQALSSFVRGIMNSADSAAFRTAIGVTTTTPATASEIRANSGNNPIVPSALPTAAAFVTLTDASTIAVDWSTFLNGQVTLTSNRTLGNPTNAQPGESRKILIKGNSSTPRTLSFASNYKGEQIANVTFPDSTTAIWTLINIECITTTHFVVTWVGALP
jgi:hypothetical protein